MKLHRILVLGFLFSLPFPSLGASTEGAPIFLELGEQRVLDLPELKQYSVSGDSVRYTRIQGGEQLLLKAVHEGLSTLFIKLSGSESRTHLIRVELSKAHPHSPELLRALNQIESSEVIDQGKHFILRGVVRSIHEARAIADLKNLFPSNIIDETTLEDGWYEQSRIQLESLVKSHPGLSLISREGSLQVQGAISNPSEQEGLIKKIKAIQPLTSIDIQTRKDSDPTLYFKIFLLEVKKEWMSKLGVGWPEAAPGSLNLSANQFLVSKPLDLTINALSERGLARVLSSPELVVKAPGQAELFAGGELPIRQKSKFSDSVIWKNVGLSLKLDVKEYLGEKVRITVETEMSHLDSVLTNDHIPGIKTNRIKTLVDGTLDQPLLLSGLLQEDFHDNMKGLPALSDLPILGKLFSSEDYQNNRSELVAVLLPHRNLPINPLNRIQSEAPRGFIPPFRNHMTATEVEVAKKQMNYPWNVL